MARILLVHGAFGGAWCWEPVMPGLRAAGHDVEALDLPGAGKDPTPLAQVTLDAYARRVCEGLAEGHVAARIYVAACVPAAGQSLMDLAALPEAAGDQVQANLVAAGDPPVAMLPAAGARIAVFGCCDEQQAAWGAEQLGPQPVIPFTEPVDLGGPGAQTFAGLPRAYVTCKQDRAILPAFQRLMLEAAGCDPVIEIDTDHSPWISRPDELVAALDRLARELRRSV